MLFSAETFSSLANQTRDLQSFERSRHWPRSRPSEFPVSSPHPPTLRPQTRYVHLRRLPSGESQPRQFCRLELRLGTRGKSACSPHSTLFLLFLEL